MVSDVNNVKELNSDNLNNKSNVGNSLVDDVKSLVPDPQVQANKSPKRHFTKAHKLKVLTAYNACTSASERGALLRREGIYHSRISAWRQQLGMSGEGNKGKSNTKRTDHLIKENEQLKRKLAQAEAIIDLQKSLGIAWDAHPPTRKHREQLMNTISQVAQEKGVSIDFICSALTIPRATYYRHLEREQHKKDDPSCPKTPINALNCLEKQAVLDLLHSERFIDKTPYDVYHELVDEGNYYCSPRTMYRILSEHGETKERRLQRNHRDAVKPELMATRPNELWSWDITKLLGPAKWVYYHLYVILDVFSRYVVGWLIADSESKELARKLIQQSALKQGIQPHQLTLHADNGPSMISHTVAQLLEHLGVAKTHNRPYTSNDNPFSESHFKTLKYRPEFPVRFQSLQHGEAFCQQFFSWYNKEHYHSGIAWLTPESVHYHQAQAILEQRHKVLMQAFLDNPVRFNNKQPQLKKLPDAVYINPPQVIGIQNNSGQIGVSMAR